MRYVWLVGLPLIVSAPALAQVPAGGEFQVNTYTTGAQYLPGVAMDANGDFIVTWTSDGQDGSGHGVRWRKYKSSGLGQAAGAANTYTTSEQDSSSIAADPEGNFVVAWSSFGQDGDARGIFARRFDRLGAPLSSEFKVNGHTQDQQFAPVVATAANGAFVVAWQSEYQDGDSYGVFARVYDALGNPGAGLQVNAYTTGNQSAPHAAMDAVGNFVVVWQGAGAGDDIGIFGRLYDATGAPRGAEFLVNAYTTNAQHLGGVAMDPAGNFVVAWESPQEGDGVGIVAQRFDAAGVPQGTEILVDAFSTSNQFNPSVAMDEHGNFVVAWDSYSQDGDNRAVVVRQFDASGAPQGSEFVVNSYTTGIQYFARVASSPDGDFVVAWTSVGQDGSGNGIYAQRFGDLVFEDNFESGDMSRWTTQQTDGTDLSVGPAGALSGTARGLVAVVNDTNSLYVQDNSPDAEIRYRARFYFEPNGFDPGEALSHQRVRIFLAQDAASLRVVTIVLKRRSGQYSVEARARQNDGSRIDTGFFDITDAPHFVEFDWTRAAGPGTHDGSLTLYVDDTPMSTLANLDNDQLVVESGRLGVLSIKDGASGTLFFDQFESRRQRAIGPE